MFYISVIAFILSFLCFILAQTNKSNNDDDYYIAYSNDHGDSML